MRASAKGRRGEPRGERGEKRRVKMRTRKSSYIGVRTATLLRRIVGVYNENETPRLVCVCVCMCVLPIHTRYARGLFSVLLRVCAAFRVHSGSFSSLLHSHTSAHSLLSPSLVLSHPPSLDPLSRSFLAGFVRARPGSSYCGKIFRRIIIMRRARAVRPLN